MSTRTRRQTPTPADVAQSINDSATELGENITATVADPPAPTVAETHQQVMWSKIGAVAIREGRKQPVIHITKPKTHDGYCDVDLADAPALQITREVTDNRVCPTCQEAAWDAGWRRSVAAIAAAINRHTVNAGIPDTDESAA